jgi:septum formation protein
MSPDSRVSRLVLASASPRRLDLLRQIGFEPEVVSVNVPESCAVDESPLAYSRRVAHDKARAGWNAIGRSRECLVLGADTEVLIDGQVLGKPADASAARHMLRQLSGRAHTVLSSVAVIGEEFDDLISCPSQVRFAELSDQEIAHYVASGEPFGKAGAYAIQGRAAAFVAHLDGSFSGVMGLPVHETALLLRRAGLR